MSIYELKILFDLCPESKSKTLDKYANEFDLGYFFVDSEDGHCYLFDRYGKEKDISLIHEINSNMIPRDIKKIVIPKNVMSIGYSTFYGCSGLTSVTIPDSVQIIEYAAFEGCNGLTYMTIPDSVTNIENWAFGGCCNITNMKIPDSVISIGDYAFFYCDKLTSVTIPDSVASIGYAFNYCSNLKSIIFKSKTIDQVKSMKNYPFSIKDESIIKAEFS